MPPFSIFGNKYLTEAFSTVTTCGYKLPDRKALSGDLLQNTVSSVDSKLSEFKVQMSVTGTTLVSDRWRNIQNRPIINFLAVTPDGAMFIDSNDTSDEQQDALFIAEEIK